MPTAPSIYLSDLMWGYDISNLLTVPMVPTLINNQQELSFDYEWFAHGLRKKMRAKQKAPEGA